jgi:hypothetical protein
LFAAFPQDFLDSIFLAELFGAPHELDLDGVIGGNLLHVLTQRVAQRLGPLWVVKDPDLMDVIVVGHPTGVTPPRDGPLNNNPVVAGEDSCDLIFVPLR